MDENRGDPRWWLREYGPKLVLLARQWVNCHADAEDVLQEAFVRFWQNRHTARDPVVYLYACVRNAAKNWRRAATRRAEHEQYAAEALFASDDTPDAGADVEEIEQALRSLPDEQREVVALKIWGGLTFDAVSNVLEIPPGTARSRYRYAIEAMRRHLSNIANN